MALVKCKECGKEVSTQAKACPSCGAAAPKKTSLVTWIVLGFIVILAIGMCVGPGDKGSSGGGSTASAPARKANSGPDRAATLKDVDAIYTAMKEMKVAAIGDNWQAALLVLGVFDKAVKTVRMAEAAKLEGEDAKRVADLKALVVKRQLETFPALRKAAVKEFDKKLWESDVDVEVGGDRATRITFIGGMFAANRNIAQAQQTMEPLMKRLRFKQSRYKWIPSAEQWTYYDMKPPADSDLVVLDSNGTAQ